MTRYFIAHSSLDKSIALALREELKESGDVWVDLFEVEVGDILLEQIAQGIEAASDFVILWSVNSASSKWVRFEFHMAFARWLEEAAINLRIVCLDDASIPLYFQPFLQLRNEQDPTAIALALIGEAPQRPKYRSFLNRNREIDVIERAIYSDTLGFVWIWGFRGIGKKSVVNAALRRVLPDPSRVKNIDIRPGTGATELGLIVSAALAADALPGRGSEVADEGAHLIRSFAEEGGIWVFREAQEWLEDDATPGPTLIRVLRALSKASVEQTGRVAIFTTTRKPRLEGTLRLKSLDTHVEGLSPDFSVGLLRERGAEGAPDLLSYAATQLHGHPLSLEIAARELGTLPIDWEEQRVRFAKDVLSSIELSDLATRLLETLAAIDGPLSGAELATYLGAAWDAYQSAVNEIVSYSLVETGADGFLRLHPLVREFFTRQFDRRPNREQLLDDLATRSKRFLDHLPVRSSAYVDGLTTTFRLLALASRLDEALTLRRDLTGVLFEAATQMYQNRKYDEALKYFRAVRENEPQHLDALLYEARCLAYKGRIDEAREMVDSELQKNPNSPKVLRVRGRIEFQARNWERALSYYQRGLNLRPSNSNLLVDIAQVRVRMEDWSQARSLLSELIDRGHDTPYSLGLYAEVLEHFDDLEVAEDTMRRAVRQEPSNPGFHHRLGRIAMRRGDRTMALEEFKATLELDPTYWQSALSLASLFVDAGDLATAKLWVDRAHAMPGIREVVVINMRANIQMMEGDLDEATKTVRRALAIDREPENVGLAAEIELRKIEAGAVSCLESRDSISDLIRELRDLGQTTRSASLQTRLDLACPD